MHLPSKTLLGFALATLSTAQCPDYSDFSMQFHAPGSSGKYNLSYMRPDEACRTFNSSLVETTLTNMQSVIQDPDLYRLFQNSFPNTLDTAVKFHGYANGSDDEELTFLITGDINAMWLRDSANQMQSYLPLVVANDSFDSLASLYRGVINLQARYIGISPHCNSFQPPVEANIAPSVNGAGVDDRVFPAVSNQSVFECKYELDSLAAFLEISTNYYETTNDTAFFGKFAWVETIQTILNVTQALQIGTYEPNGMVNALPYNWQRQTTSATETQSNNGGGNPFNSATGLIRSFFRPSDDATIYQGFIPANMMFSRYLASCAPIMTALNQTDLASQMTSFAAEIRAAIEKWGVTTVEGYGEVYAYEVDGYGGFNMMDDANIPSLLSSAFFGYTNVSDPVYQATRKLVLGTDDPYFMHGPVINAVGGPHDGPGMAWPMAAIMQIFTSDNDTEITTALGQILSSTDGLGLVHESINTFNQTVWTREWFSWVNGLFGQMILDLNTRKPEILAQSFQ